MEAKDWQLFKQDLCARLPFGVKVSILGSGPMELKSVVNSTIGWFAIIDGAPTDFGIDEIKPYLRPMSSMTEEELKEFTSFASQSQHRFFRGDSYFWYNNYEEEDWLNKHHFDYRGLIEKGLAIEASAEMYSHP